MSEERMKGILKLKTFIKHKYEDFRKRNPLRKCNPLIIYVLLGIVASYVLIHDLIGTTVFTHNAWDSYTLQTMSWREGRIDLGQNYEYLELAIYNGKYYVSFPPVPSLLMLPWTYIYGYETPNNLIMIIYVIITVTFAYLCARDFRLRPESAAFMSVFYVLGSNMFWMSTMGGVWFQAQLAGMMLATISIYAMIKDQREISYAALALAVGCRPFYILYFPVLFAWFFSCDRRKKGAKSGVKGLVQSLVQSIGYQALGLAAAAIIGLVYMAYNYARFGNVLEFGHNYLPEFLEAENGQFSLVYLKENLHNILFRGIELDENFKMNIPIFNGFRFYIANPMFLVLFALTGLLVVSALYRLVYRLIKKKETKVLSKRNDRVKYDRTKSNIVYSRYGIFIGVLIYFGLIANMLALCVHKTFGGWQFGCRYMCDLLAFSYLFILMAYRGREKLYGFEVFIGIFAIAFNAYGIMYMQ